MGNDTSPNVGNHNLKQVWDQGFKKKIEQDIEPMQRTRSYYLENYKKDKENAIYTLIRICTISNGISHQKLAEFVELDRKSLRPYIKDLMKKGLVKIVRRNKQTLYLSTEEFHQDPVFKAEVFGTSFQSKLRDKKFKILNEEEKTPIKSVIKKDENDNLIQQTIRYDFTKYKQLFEPKFSQNDNIEKVLFEFSNQIGAFITYLIIYCMNPENHNTNLSRDENDRITQKMFQTAMNKITPYLIIRFSDFLNNMSNIFNTKHTTKKRKGINSKESSRHYLPKDFIAIKLLDAFVRLYPLMIFEFEKILDKRYFFQEVLEDYPPAIEGYKKQLISYNQMLKQQETCKHDFGKPTESIFGTIIQQCSKCKYIQKVKKKSKLKQ